MRILAIFVVFSALALPAMAAARPIPSPSPVPQDVRDALAQWSSIGVADATDVAPSTLPVGPARAYRAAAKAFARDARPKTVLAIGSGWSLLLTHPITISLVRLTGRPQGAGWTDIDPLQVGDLVWIVVIRNVPIPNLGPPNPLSGSFWLESLVVFVRTDVPRRGPAISF